jgi:hypothetical protein
MFPSILLAATLAVDGSPFAAEAELSAAITEAELKARVYRLASPEFLGRRGAGGVRAAEHIAEAFKKAGLSPAFGESYFQPIPWLLSGDRRNPEIVGRNVGGMIVGSDPGLRDEWIVLAAHFDHLGVRGEVVHPGADDNASGVAMLLEVAETLALKKVKPRRTILFVSFDLEEQGLQGSSHFAAHPPRDYSKLKAILVADLIGRSMAGLMDEYVFVLGSESADGLRSLVTEIKPEPGLTVGRLGADLVGTRSDYGPFRDRKTPFLFFTTGTHRDYHRPTDRPDRLDYAKLSRISRWIAAITQRLADESPAPRWALREEPDLVEARTVLILLRRVLENPDQYPLNDDQRRLVQSARDRLEDVMARQTITPEERKWLVWTARYLMFSVF